MENKQEWFKTTTENRIELDGYNSKQETVILSLIMFGYDPSPILNPEMGHHKMEKIMEFIKDEYPVDWITEEHDYSQLYEIKSAYDDYYADETKRPMLVFLHNPKLDDDQIEELDDMIDNGFDIEPFATGEYNETHIEEINDLMLSLENEDCRDREAKEKALDFLIKHPGLNSGICYRAERWFTAGLDLNVYYSEHLTFCHYDNLVELAKEGKLEEFDYIFSDPEFNEEQMNLLMIYINKKKVYNIKNAAKPQYDYRKMEAIILAEFHEFDTTQFKVADLTGDQCLDKLHKMVVAKYTCKLGEEDGKK